MSHSDSLVLFWRRIDIEGLERLTLTVGPSGVQAASTVIGVTDGGFRLDHAWQLTADWRAVSLRVDRWGAEDRRVLTLERDGQGWRVNGERRTDLDGTAEPDLSATPFCNTLPIRRLLASGEASVTVDVAYVSAKDLKVARSRQRYERQGPGRIRYVDLGLFRGFVAELKVDDRMLVVSYEGLFERVASESDASGTFAFDDSYTGL
jgi:hypothetical protein